MDSGNTAKLETEELTIMEAIINTDTIATIIYTVMDMVATQITIKVTLPPIPVTASTPKSGGSSSRKTSSTV